MDLIRECLNQIKLRLRLDTAIVDKLEELESRCYRLEEDNKLLKAHNKLQDEMLQQLRLVVQNESKKSVSRPAAPTVPAAAAAAAPQSVGY